MDLLHVAGQVNGVGEARRAELTPEGSLAVMDLPVSLQSKQLCELTRAPLTFVRLLARVAPLVLGSAGCCCECSRAEFTFVWFLTAVRSHVAGQPRRPCER